MNRIPTFHAGYLCTAVFLLLWSHSALAQGHRASSQTGDIISKGGYFPAWSQDTIVPDEFFRPCGDSVTVYAPDSAWGFMSGTNGYGDLQKAQLVSTFIDASVDLVEAWVFFAVNKGPGLSTIKMNVYATFFTGPLFFTGSSESILASQIRVSPDSLVPTIFLFPDTLRLTALPFFAVDFSDCYANHDTLATYTTKDPCRGYGSWEQHADSIWYAVNDSTSGWGLDLAFYMAAIVKIGPGVAIDDKLGWEGISLKNIEVQDQLATLSYEQSILEPVEMAIYSATGAHLATWTEHPGTHGSSFDHGALPSGVYVWMVSTSHGRVGLKWRKP